MIMDNIILTAEQSLKIGSSELTSTGITGAMQSSVMAKGTLTTSLENIWTLTIMATTLTHSVGALVTQTWSDGSTTTGTLKVALTGLKMKSIVIEAQSFNVFSDELLLTIQDASTLGSNPNPMVLVAAAKITAAVQTGEATKISIHGVPSSMSFTTDTDLMIGNGDDANTKTKVEMADIVSAASYVAAAGDVVYQGTACVPPAILEAEIGQSSAVITVRTDLAHTAFDATFKDQLNIGTAKVVASDIISITSATTYGTKTTHVYIIYIYSPH